MDIISRAKQLRRETLQLAMEAMEKEQQSELERLEELKVINPSIKQEELDFVKQQTIDLKYYIDNSQCRLDALRIIYAG